jgi:hypothetical protein
LATSDLLVVRTDTAGVDTTLVLTTDYSVSLNSDQTNSPGGTVTLAVAPATGFQLSILRNVSLTQGTSLPNQGAWYPKVVENALDKLTMIVQQLGEKINRAVVAGVTIDPTALLASISNAVNSAIASAASASTSAGTATTGANTATTQAGIATTQAGIATTAANIANGGATQIKTADFTAVAGGKYAIDTLTNGIRINVTLPVSFAAEDTLIIYDYKNNFGTVGINVLRNGNKIMNLAEDMTVDSTGIYFWLVGVDATKGWAVR